MSRIRPCALVRRRRCLRWVESPTKLSPVAKASLHKRLEYELQSTTLDLRRIAEMAEEDPGLLTFLLRIAAQEEIAAGPNALELAIVAAGRFRLLQYLKGEDRLSQRTFHRGKRT